jgi:hypothetical protein
MVRTGNASCEPACREITQQAAHMPPCARRLYGARAGVRADPPASSFFAVHACISAYSFIVMRSSKEETCRTAKHAELLY